MKPAQLRWRKARFGKNQDLMLRDKWMGSVEPEIDGSCAYTTRTGRGYTFTQEEAKRRVEAEATD